MLTLSFSFLIAEITPIAFATIGWRYYIVFASTNFFLILPCKHDISNKRSGVNTNEIYRRVPILSRDQRPPPRRSRSDFS